MHYFYFKRLFTQHKPKNAKKTTESGCLYTKQISYIYILLIKLLGF